MISAMKRAILIATMVLAAATATSAPAAKPQLTVLLAGGPESNKIAIALAPDGRSYAIDSIVPLDVGGSVCWHPEEQLNQLLCDAASIDGFEVNAGGGDDFVAVATQVQAPVTLRGGPGRDRLLGGGGADKLVGGPDEDVLLGRGGSDSLFGGPGRDLLFGGSGDDLLHGDVGEDVLRGHAGSNTEVQ